MMLKEQGTDAGCCIAGGFLCEVCSPCAFMASLSLSTDIISQSKFAVAVNVMGQGVLSLAQCQLAQASLSFDFYITC